jgi:AraC-like DNA-binding protein
MRGSSELIKATTLTGFSTLVKELNADPRTLMAKARISPLLLENPDSYIPFKDYCRLMELAAQTTKIPEFGLLLGEKQNLSTLGIIGLALQQAQSHAEAMDLYSRYFHMHNQCATISMSSTGGISQLTHTTNTVEHYPHTQAKLKSLCTVVSVLRLQYGESWHPIKVCFDFSPIGNRRTMSKILRSPIAYDQPESCVLFQTQSVDASFSGPNKNSFLQSILHHYLDTMNDRVGHDLSSRVIELIKTTLMTGQCNKEKISEILSLNPRTLQRRLALENTDFRSLLNSVRKDAAQHYLLSTNLSVTEIAEILGYRDLSAFSRAFKHWYGVSPQDWLR